MEIEDDSDAFLALEPGDSGLVQKTNGTLEIKLDGDAARVLV